MRYICFKSDNTVKTKNYLIITYDRLYCGFVSCTCFKVWVVLFWSPYILQHINFGIVIAV
jgi:hypothetical protein